MRHPSQYRGKRVVVLGMARSGVAVAHVFHRHGAHVIVNERLAREQCPEAPLLEQLGITVVCGEHPLTLLDHTVALLIKNPGIPYTHPLVEKSISLGIPVVTEVEVTSALLTASMIGITGSNGKTTTTTLVYEMLKRSALACRLAGNIGIPVISVAEEASAAEWIVTELSSFQLKGTQSLRVHIAALLNIVPTHLDYHGTMEDYVQAKAQIVAQQTAADYVVVNAQDAHCLAIARRSHAQCLLFSITEKVTYGTCIVDGHVAIVLPGKQSTVLPVVAVSALLLRGTHNVENVLAAVAIAYVAGASIEAMRHVLTTFRGVAHRLEWCAQSGGIDYYNDSKATNVTATVKSIGALADRPIVLIAGGLDRGNALETYTPLFSKAIKAVVVLGQTAPLLGQAATAAGICVKYTTTQHPQEAMKQAVREAQACAVEGDVVLLSPACASWDMYASFEQRGNTYKETVFATLYET